MAFDDPMVELEVCKKYDVLTCKVPDLLYWESSVDLDCEKFLQNAVTIPMAHIFSSQICFIAQVHSPITKEWIVVSKCSTTNKFSTEFSGPVVGIYRDCTN